MGGYFSLRTCYTCQSCGFVICDTRPYDSSKASDSSPEILLRGDHPVQISTLASHISDVATRIKAGLERDENVSGLLPYLHNPNRPRPKDYSQSCQEFFL